MERVKSHHWEARFMLLRIPHLQSTRQANAGILNLPLVYTVSTKYTVLEERFFSVDQQPSVMILLFLRIERLLPSSCQRDQCRASCLAFVR